MNERAAMVRSVLALVVVLASSSRAHAQASPSLGLAAHLVTAAQDDDCDAVRTIVIQLQQLDPSYARTFASDAVISACISPTPHDDHGDTHDGFIVGAAFGVGTGAQLDGRIGSMIGRHFAIFGSLTAGAGVSERATSYALAALGLRAWLPGYFERVFVDLRYGYGSGYHDECSCTQGRPGFLIGLGIELVRARRCVLELHAEAATVGDAGGVVAGLGVSF